MFLVPPRMPIGRMASCDLEKVVTGDFNLE